MHLSHTICSFIFLVTLIADFFLFDVEYSNEL